MRNFVVNRQLFAIVCLLSISGTSFGVRVERGEECPENEPLCEYYLEIEERLVVRHNDTVNVKADFNKNGRCPLGVLSGDTCEIEDDGDEVGTL